MKSSFVAVRSVTLRRLRSGTSLALLVYAIVGLLHAPSLAQRVTDVNRLRALSQQLHDDLIARRTAEYYELLQSPSPAQRALNQNPRLKLMFMRENGTPAYYLLHNLIAAKTVRTYDIWPGGVGGGAYGRTGSNTAAGNLAIWDGSGVRTDHQEFGGRVTQQDGAAVTYFHATHVAGTMVAAGVDANARGMSYQAPLHAYDWDFDTSEMAAAAAGGLQVSNHSYGFAAGWDGDYWFGDISVSTTEDAGFGFYDQTAQDFDQIAYDAPNYLICVAAGNDRNDADPGGSHYHWDGFGWVLASDFHGADGQSGGYDTMSYTANAKNILTVGAVNDIPLGYAVPSDVVQTVFSSWGPTDDGRIKPDIVANGMDLYSSGIAGSASYEWSSGTSMATPNASGSINLLAQEYEARFGSPPLASTLKALVINTADEAGAADGPDYANGWGLLNTHRAMDVLNALSGDDMGTLEATLAGGSTHTYYFSVDATQDVRLTIAWTDPAGIPPGWALDPTTKMLVNDLDVRMTNVGTATTHSPWILNPASPASAASSGDNDTDNVEQVDVAAAPSGLYAVTVSHKGALASGAQEYAMVWRGMRSVPPPQRVYVSASASGANDGSSWTDAYTDLQSALSIVSSGDEVWVAAGTYKPTPGTDRAATFQLISGVALYGGFAGTETSLAQRDWKANLTILSGDIGVQDDPADNSYHVVTGGNVDDTAVVDGFTIAGGRADNSVGGGLFNDLEGNATLANLVFDGNYASYKGGAIYNNYYCSPKMTNVVFRGNTSNVGGAIYNDIGSNPAITNAVFLENSAILDGGAIYNREYSNPVLTNTTFTRNVAGSAGGAIYNFFSSPIITNGILFDDSATIEGNEIRNFSTPAVSNPLVSYSLIEGSGGSGGWDPNLGTDLGGNIDDDPLFTDAPGGDLRISESSPAVDAGSNAAVPGGVATDLDGNPRIAGGTVDMGAYEFQVAPIPVAFNEVGAFSGTDDTGYGDAVAWGDFNNDGVLDLYVANVGTANRLYRSSGDGTFAEVAAVSGMFYIGASLGAAWGDYNDDGNLDLYLVNYGDANRLYQNNGDGTFLEVGVASNTADSGDGRGGAWADYDADGDLDLYVANDGGNKLYSSNGDGTFSDATVTSGTADGGSCISAAWGDYDNDGDPDLYVTRSGTNRLFRNNGDGTFLDVAPSAGTDGASIGAGWGDYDNDGDLDLYVTGGSGNRLHRNNGDGTFTDVGAESGTSAAGGNVVAWGDYDNDADLDFFVGGRIHNSRLYRNNADGTFAEVAVASGLAGDMDNNSAAWCDYDNDGDIDLYVAYDGANHLYRNDNAVAPGDHWLQVDLAGTASNRSGIGARIRCVAGTTTQIREVSGGSGSSQNSLTAEFGLGTAAVVDSLEIHWPSGIVQTLTGQSVDQRITVTESAPVTLQFSEVGIASGTAGGANADGVAWGDYDGDGDLDLYLAYSGAANALYRNNGDGTFTDVAAASGTDDAGAGKAVAWGDYDNDGDLDLYVANSGTANRLYENDGAGGFTEVGAASGTDDGGDGRAAGWADYDNDGDIDLCLANNAGADRLYRNNGDGTFTDIAVAAGTDANSNGAGIAWADYDNDGDLDLYFVDYGGVNQLYRNNGDGTFTDVATASGTGDGGWGIGVAWGDYDDDGDLDLYLANDIGINRLYQNNGDGTFAEVGAASGTNDAGNGRSVAWGDYDNDGDLDLYLANVGTSRLYRNDGDGTFTDASVAAGTENGGFAGGIGWGDYDNDGDLDLYVANADMVNRLYRNDSAVPPGYHWLHVDLVGTVSNQSGIGARVRCVAGGKSQLREIAGDAGYESQNSLAAEFGLGTATIVDTLEIRWPSGVVQTLASQSVDQRITMTEPAPAPPQFTDVGAPSGTGDGGNGRGMAWGDYDDDGNPDLYLTNNGANRLYRNNGDGTFDEVGSTSQTDDGGYGHGTAWGDYDNDGDLDLYMADFGGSNRLYQNNNDGTFSEVGAASGTADAGAGVAAAWGDYDGDGHLDLYVANEAGASRLYHGNGDATFTEVAAAAGVAFSGYARGTAWGDYDGDGDLDLYLATNVSNPLYRNNGEGTFTEVGASSGSNDAGNGYGVAWGDYDNDGDLDVYVANFGSANRLYQNDGNGTFTEIGAAAGTDDGGNGISTAWGDYDNDGSLDLYVANKGGPNRLYRNNGDGTFTETSDSTATDDNGQAYGVGWADYDGDGDLDIYLVNASSPNRLYRNDTAVPLGYHWLHVDLVGTASNGSGIGARVRCVTGTTRRTDEVSGGCGLSQNSLTAEFGLGTASVVDTLEIRWPSGIVQVLTNQSVDQRITVMELQRFTEVGATAGTGDGGAGFGSAWGDYDGDGDIDLYLTNHGVNRLYQNNGDGTFADVATASGTDDGAYGNGAAWADYDNDGDLDLYVCNGAANRLYRSNGDGTFTEVGASSNTDDSADSRAAVWGDYDRDGYVDLYVTNAPGANRLYGNNGDGTFTDAGSASGTDDSGTSQSAAWGDYDNDGDLDLYVGDEGVGNRLYRNNDDGTFTDVGSTSGTDDAGLARAVAWGDYDNDGYLDLYVSNAYGTNRMYHNEGDGTFTEVGGAAGTDDGANSNGASWGDYDNDGNLDLYLVNHQYAPNRLYRNNGDGTFTDVGASTETGDSPYGIDVSWGDYDDDGDLDLYVTKSNGANRLFRNDAVPPGRHWLHVNLTGSASNRSGIGARVRCVAGASRQIRDVGGGSGLHSQNSPGAAFGLGAATVVDSLEVRWPSGTVQVLTDQAADQRIAITEPAATAITEYPILPSQYALHANAPNPFNPVTTIRYDVPVPGGPVEILIFDVRGRRVRTLVSETMPPGMHAVTWSGTGERGEPAASGIYFVRMTAGSFTQTRKVILLK